MSLTDPRQWPEAYAAAVYAKDVEAFTALYAPDAHAFDAWGAAPLNGQAAFRDMAAEWFGSLGDERVVVTCRELHSAESADLATLHAFIEFQAVNTDGQPLRAVQERVTWVLARLSGGWVVTHQHTSAPLGFGTAGETAD